MTIVKEYRNVLRTDVKKLVNTSYDKKNILEAFIERGDLVFRIKEVDLK